MSEATPKYEVIEAHSVPLGIGTKAVVGGQTTSTLYMSVPSVARNPREAAAAREMCERVARAVNAHDELVAMLNRCHAFVDKVYHREGWVEASELRAAISQTLIKATKP